MKACHIKIKLLFLFNISFATLFLCGCSEESKEMKPEGKAQPMEDSHSIQILRINVQGDIASLNPHTGIDLNCRSMQKALFEGLVRLSPQGIPEPASAERIDVSPSQTVYTFTIRPVLWSNGEPLTAAHFEKTWKKALSPTSNCLRADLFYPIKNAEAAKKGKASIDTVGIHAVDDRTLVVELEHPTPFFLDLLASPNYFPLYPESSDEPTIFNGPFKVAKWLHDQSLDLIANDKYWDKKSVSLERIEISFVTDPRTALLMYEKKEIDWVGSPFINLPVDAIPELQANNELINQSIAGVYWFCINTHKFPLNSAKIRKALSYAINRREIADHVLHGESPTRSPVPITMDLLAENELYPDGNVEEAKKLFQEGLEELNITLDDFPVIHLSHSDVAGHKNIAEAVAEIWQKTLGINVELVGSEWNVFFANMGNRNFDIGGCVWYFAYNDPLYTLEFFRDPACRYNSPGWHNDEYLKLLNLANQETDQTKRKEYLKQAALVLLGEMPIIPIFSVNYRYLKNDAVENVYISDLGHADFKWAHMKEKAAI